MALLKQRSFEVLPALVVRGKTMRSTLRTITTAWMVGIIWAACVTGSPTTTFGRLLGFTDVDFGIWAAIPFAATLGQLIVSVVIERTGVRKYIFLVAGSIHRMLWMAMAAVPLVFGASRTAITVLLSIYALNCLLAHVSNTPWMNWMGDLIPRRIRGRYLANRTLWTLPIQIVVVIATGLILDHYTVPGAAVSITAQPKLLYAIVIMFTIGAVCGTIDILSFLHLREIVTPPLLQDDLETSSLGATLKAALVEPLAVIVDSFKNSVFRHYVLYSAVIAFSLSVADQFYWLNALEVIGMSKLGANFLFMVVGALAAMGTARPAGALIDRWGRRPVLILATLVSVVSPVPWFFIIPGHVVWAYILGAIACILGGAAFTAINLAATSVIWGFSQSTGRSKFIAAAGFVASTGGLIGGLAGGRLTQALSFLQTAPILVGPFSWNNYHVTFALGGVARIAAILWLVGMPDPGARGFRNVVRELGFNAFSNVMSRLFWPLRSHNVLRRAMDEQDRAGRPTDKPEK